MSRRMSIATGILVVVAGVFALLLAASVPALAHHKDGHEQGPPAEETEEESADESSSASSSDEDEGSSSNGNGNGKDKKESSSSSQSDSSSTSSGSGSSQDRYEPDPPPQDSPQATKGPRSCPDYSEESGGPYDHDNCDGSQGLHGNGGNGKCAGCTGKADDKSPGGQYPGDHNNGYECDWNSGVGKGNPAHAKCKPPTGPPPPPPPPPDCPPNSNRPECRPQVVEVCDADMTQPGIQVCANPVQPCDADLLMPGIQPCIPDVVLGRRDFAPPERPPTPPTPPEIAPRPPLPFTGAGSTSGLIVIALLMMVLGGVLTRATRRL